MPHQHFALQRRFIIRLQTIANGLLLRPNLCFHLGNLLLQATHARVLRAQLRAPFGLAGAQRSQTLRERRQQLILQETCPLAGGCLAMEGFPGHASGFRHCQLPIQVGQALRVDVLLLTGGEQVGAPLKVVQLLVRPLHPRAQLAQLLPQPVGGFAGGLILGAEIVLDKVMGVGIGHPGRLLRIGGVKTNFDQPRVGHHNHAQIVQELPDQLRLALIAQAGLQRERAHSHPGVFPPAQGRLALPVESADGLRGQGLAFQYVDLGTQVVLKTPAVHRHRILDQGGGAFAIQGDARHSFVAFGKAQRDQRHRQYRGHYKRQNGKAIFAQHAQIGAQVSAAAVSIGGIEPGSAGKQLLPRLWLNRLPANQIIFRFHSSLPPPPANTPVTGQIKEKRKERQTPSSPPALPAVLMSVRGGPQENCHRRPHGRQRRCACQGICRLT